MVVELPYTLHTRYASIAVAWTIILIPPIFINLGLFYGLWYGTDLDRILGSSPSLRAQRERKNHVTTNKLTVLTLPTGILGIFTIIAIIERICKLTKKDPQFRPLKSQRYALDIFQWGYFGALLLISALISSTLARGDIDQDGHEMQIRLISMPAAVLMYFLATLTFLSLLINAIKVELPFRFGSVEKGNKVRPAIYYIVEDVVAVDGNGGLEYREAFTSRYENSPVFQRLVWNLSVVWMVGFYVFAAGFTILVFRLPVAAVYAVGWAGPFPLAGLMAVWTIFYVKAKLGEERAKEEEAGSDDGEDERTLRPSADERTPLLGS
jgi:hypothetical protein